MEINSTLIIQIINFIIAYFFLRRWLLKPAILVLQQEAAEKQALFTIVDARKIIVAQKELDKKNQWNAYQQSFREQIPASVSPFTVSYADKQLLIKPMQISQAALDTLTHDIVDAVAQRMEHVS